MPGTPRIWRSLILEQDVFYPPEDGWGERIYLSSFPAGSIHYLLFQPTLYTKKCNRM